MTTSAGNSMPMIDVSAAIQAAVAAAAEIARVGFSDPLAVSATMAPAPALQGHVSTAPRSKEQANPLPSSLLLTAQPKQPALVVKNRSEGCLQTASDQCTGQDAGGDQQRLHNDMGLTSCDAAGETTFEESEEDAAKRLARSRERNREHARRTRLRKKAQLEGLQSKVRSLETEKKALKQKIEECSIASILINLADASQDEQQDDETTSLLDATIQRQEENREKSEAKIHLLTTGKRKRFASVDTSEENKAPQTLRLQIDGETKLIGPKSHINWKSGVYSDESGIQRQLTSEQLERLRRERNRMHAKMTRDRKKNFIATIEKTIEELERDCQKMRDVLHKVGAHQESLAAPVTPLTSPRDSLPTSKAQEPAASAMVEFSAAPSTCSLLSAAVAIAPHTKPFLATAFQPEPESTHKHGKVAHGFSWNG